MFRMRRAYFRAPHLIPPRWAIISDDILQYVSRIHA